LTETKTPKDFFENTLPRRFKPDKTEGIDIDAQIKITGPNGGNWIVTIRNQQLQVKQGIHPSPKLTLEIAEADYMDLVNGKISGEKAFLTGKLRFKGNIGLALKLRDAGFL
jgi:putative sterol carrier protein